MPLRSLRAGAAMAAVLTLATCVGEAGWSGDSEPIRVGVLFSMTGNLAIIESSMHDATMLAIDEINAEGGVAERRIEPVAVDARSDFPTYAAEAERLLTEERVSTIFGCYTSASRKTILPIIEQHDALLMYSTFYEGIESSPHVVYTGAAPNQFVTPAVKWFLDHRGRRFFLVGSDYVYPRVTNAVIKDQLRLQGGEVVGEEYRPLGESDFSAIIDAIRRERPEVIVSTVIGDSNVPFFRGLREAGVTPDATPTLSVALGETELQHLDTRQMAGDYVAMNYFQSIPSAENDRFVRSFKARFGADAVISDPVQSAYLSVKLWAQAVARAGGDGPHQVRQAIHGLSYQAPEGTVYVDELNQHTWKTARIGQITPDGQVDIVWSSDTVVRPAPYSAFRPPGEWDELLLDLYTGWGDQWARSP